LPGRRWRGCDLMEKKEEERADLYSGLFCFVFFSRTRHNLTSIDTHTHTHRRTSHERVNKCRLPSLWRKRRRVRRNEGVGAVTSPLLAVTVSYTRPPPLLHATKPRPRSPSCRANARRSPRVGRPASWPPGRPRPSRTPPGGRPRGGSALPGGSTPATHPWAGAAARRLAGGHRGRGRGRQARPSGGPDAVPRRGGPGQR